MSDEVEIKDPQGLLKAYEQAKADLVSLRNEKKELEKSLEGLSEETVNKWRTRAVKEAARASLERSGLPDAERILKYLNLDDVDFDDKDQLAGIDEKLEEVKADFPELFDTKRRAGRNSADIHASAPAEAKMTGTQAQLARVLHKG